MKLPSATGSPTPGQRSADNNNNNESNNVNNDIIIIIGEQAAKTMRGAYCQCSRPQWELWLPSQKTSKSNWNGYCSQQGQNLSKRSVPLASRDMGSWVTERICQKSLVYLTHCWEVQWENALIHNNTNKVRMPYLHALILQLWTSRKGRLAIAADW